MIMMRKAIRRAMQKRRERKATANGDPSEPPDAADQTGPVRG